MVLKFLLPSFSSLLFMILVVVVVVVPSFLSTSFRHFQTPALLSASSRFVGAAYLLILVIELPIVLYTLEEEVICLLISYRKKWSIVLSLYFHLKNHREKMRE